MIMKKLFPLFTAFVLLFAVASWAADNTMTGWIVDDKCGAKGANAKAESCTKACIGRGAKAVLVTDDKQEVVAIHNQDAIKGHEGHHVKLSGSMMDGALHVDKVEMAAAPAADEHSHK
jgi:hypothetical protein